MWKSLERLEGKSLERLEGNWINRVLEKGEK